MKIDSPLKRRNNETEDAYLVRLFENKDHYGLDNYKIADLMNSATGKNFSESKWRKDYAQYVRWKAFHEYEKLNSDEDIDEYVEDEIISNYKSEVEILKDGTQKSDKLIKMSIEDSKNPKFLLEAHGYDPKEWEIINAKSSIWNQHNKTDGTLTLYSSKITVKPKKNGFDFDKLLETIGRKVTPIKVERNNDKESSKLLEIPLYDMHFGISDLEYYKPHLSEILNKIKSRYWNKILFVIGQDLIHHDNFKSQTSNGTTIENVDIVKAFNDALDFYVTLIREALENSESVDCIYSKGNHDESMSYGLFRTLQATFPQANFDNGIEQRKAFIWEKVFLGFSHGDKGANRLIENFVSEFGKLIANAEIKEVHTGHLHSEKSKDQFGIIHRTLATANKTDSWHDENGFVGQNKRFQIFEYSPSSLDAIYYI